MYLYTSAYYSSLVTKADEQSEPSVEGEEAAAAGGR